MFVKTELKLKKNTQILQKINDAKWLLKTSIKNKIKYLTLYAFSTENWKRPKKEIKFLFKLLDNFIDQKINEFNKNNVKLKIIGNINVFNKKLKKKLQKSEKLTRNNQRLQVNLALNYGSKLELVNAIIKLK